MTDKPSAFRTVVRRLSRKTSTKLLGLSDNNDRQETLEKQNEREHTKKNMNDMITKNLSHKIPSNGKNTVYFNYLEGVWKLIEEEENIIKIYSRESNYFHKDDKAAEAQSEYLKFVQDSYHAAKVAGKDFNENEHDSIRSLRNQLTYAERTTQTINPEIKTRSIQTAKLERNKYTGALNKWDIFDKYVDLYILEKEEEKRKAELLLNTGKKNDKSKKEEYSGESLSKPSLYKVLKVVERQILQSMHFMNYLNYREWERVENSTKDNKIELLLGFPDQASIKGKCVTSMVWNTKYEDLFACGYGNYKFPVKQNEGMKTDDKEDRNDDGQENGYIMIFSIKNNFFPEIKYKTESGVMSLDFSSVEPSLLVAGMYDGTVAVYDLRLKSFKPMILSDIRHQKHMDPVWQVKWYYEKGQEDMVFYSISTDGKIFKWSFFKNKNSFEQEEIITFKYTDTQNELSNQGVELEEKEKGEENLIFGNSGGMCLDFNKHDDFKHLFVCGTEEGHIYLCSVKHRGCYIQNFEGHTMGVYTVAWNVYHPKIFASCSADWTIKIWHYKTFAPLIIFDIQNAVGDVAWSPWCSTIFAAVTVNGDVKFFDLNVDRKSYIYEKRYSEIAINHICFNKNEYVFLTGNDRGKVRLWRMDKTLRETKEKKDEEENNEEKEKAAKQSEMQTKLIIPRNLIVNNKKKQKVVVISKDNKSNILNNKEHLKIERDRIVDFLQLLDVKDCD